MSFPDRGQRGRGRGRPPPQVVRESDVFGHNQPSPGTQPSTQQAPDSCIKTTSENFRKAAEGYLNDSAFSDFTILCAGRTFKVHRCFICAHSRWFERCCKGMFKEASTKQVELKDDRVEAVERMIQFFYTWDYDDRVAVDSEPHLESPEPCTSLQMNAYVYALADKYDVPALKDLALQKFKAAGKNNNASVDSMLMKRMAYTVYKHIPCDNTIRIIAVSMWIFGGPELISNTAKDSMVDFLGDVPEFAADLTGSLLIDRPQGREAVMPHLPQWSNAREKQGL